MHVELLLLLLDLRLELLEPSVQPHRAGLFALECEVRLCLNVFYPRVQIFHLRLKLFEPPLVPGSARVLALQVVVRRRDLAFQLRGVRFQINGVLLPLLKETERMVEIALHSSSELERIKGMLLLPRRWWIRALPELQSASAVTGGALAAHSPGPW